MHKTYKTYFLFLIIVFLSFLVFFIAPNLVKADIYAPISINCDREGQNGDGCNYLRSTGSEDAYRIDWSLMADGFGDSGAAGGGVGMWVCFSPNGVMWDGPCVEAIHYHEGGTPTCGGSGTYQDGRIGNNKGCAFTGVFEPPDLSPGYRYLNVAVYANDAHLWGTVAIYGKSLVTPPPTPEPTPTPTADLKANGSDGPITISYNSAATLSWTSTDATSCSLSPLGSSGTSNSVSTGNLTVSQNYALSCSGEGGTASDSVQVNVESAAPTPTPTPSPTVSLSASPTSITAGQSATLTWSSTNATSCTASGGWSGSKTLSGSESGSPTQTATYTLTCTGSGGSASASATVTVTSTCSNGATNYPTCNTCTSPQTLVGGVCTTPTSGPATVHVISDTADAYIFNHFSMSKSVGWNGSHDFTDASGDQYGGWYRVEQYPGGRALFSNSGEINLPPGGNGTITIKFNPTPSGPVTGTLTPSAWSCIIPIGASSCPINFSWSTIFN